MVRAIQVQISTVGMPLDLAFPPEIQYANCRSIPEYQPWLIPIILEMECPCHRWCAIALSDVIQPPLYLRLCIASATLTFRPCSLRHLGIGKRLRNTIRV